MPTINRVFLATYTFVYDDGNYSFDHQFVFTRSASARGFKNAILSAPSLIPFAHSADEGMVLTDVILRGVQPRTLYRGDLDNIVDRLADQYNTDEYENIQGIPGVASTGPGAAATDEDQDEGAFVAAPVSDQGSAFTGEYRSGLPEDDEDETEQESEARSQHPAGGAFADYPLYDERARQTLAAEARARGGIIMVDEATVIAQDASAFEHIDLPTPTPNEGETPSEQARDEYRDRLLNAADRLVAALDRLDAALAARRR